MEMPQSDKGWSSAKLTNDQATSVLEKMNADMKQGNTKAAKLTGAMLLREFLMLRVAPLQARLRPVWMLGGEEDKICLSPGTLSDEELAVALRLLVGDDQEYLPSATVPLFRRKDGAQVVAAMTSFDERGLVPPVPLVVPEATALVDVSSDGSHKGEEEEDEERDTEMTPEGMGETSPLSKADIHRTLPDDDGADVLQEKEEPPAVPTRGRSALISRDAASAPTPPGAASGPSVVPSSAPRVRAPAPQAGRISVFKLSKRRVDYTMVDQPTPAAKKRKEEAVVPLGANAPTPAASPSVEKGSVGAHVSPPRSSSRGLGKDPREESSPVAPLAPKAPVSGSVAEVSKAQEPPVSHAVVTTPSPPPPAALLIPGPSASPDVLERALLEMAQLREDLQGADSRLVAGRLELVSGWLHSDASVRATLSQATATSEREKQAAAQAAAAHEAALKDVEAA
nr:microtubule-associated protein 4-like [Aegilops tauschii subsp. strangulata]